MNDVQERREVATKELNEFFDCEFKEILLLVDYLSVRLEKGDAICQGGAIINDKIRETIDRISRLASQSGSYGAEDVSFIFKAKCLLNHLAYPANGLTIAYTYMYVEDESNSMEKHGGLNFSGARYSRISVAKDAFPRIVANAQHFRRVTDQMSLWVVIITVISAILLSIVSYGAQAIARFEQDRVAHMKSIDDLYSTLAKQFAPIAAATPPSKLVKEHCEPPGISSETYQIIEMCNEYSYIAKRYEAAVDSVLAFKESWAFWPIKFIFKIPNFRGNWQEDARSVGIVLSTFTSYILPILFAVIGSVAASVRGIYEKVQDGVLAPRDRILTLVRLPLGLIAGVTVGLFFDPSTVVTHVSLGAGLSLSASAIAFAAGYGAETFFSKIDSLINHVFGFRRSERPVLAGGRH
ncbi:hypothetical protein BGV71_07520 [Burkholderia ubonensis]|uniref:hypothetical protein n=1 Tax=Burkholderia ubonensis TaxID=101571 RepID=UPI000758A923|nr:hypothetical protein [Burkholderia ubonensis]KVQ15109.1 hypothetical protein WJ99_07650 [Burkholderia ubonensis]KVU88814.1 hypothetical protein WK76_18885 [Burkholderia ubonensis]OJA89934.1 hypothetical protein BGV71_07520 [Burkholderia ubonensis]OJB35047.1 hypothetical protein BGV56_16505 [Burkholderia ubonensis]